MVGVSDIPCVGKILDRISDAAVDVLFRGFRYMFCYKGLVKTLNSEVEKANTETARVSTKVAAERANGKLIEAHVLKWQNEAEADMKSAEEFTLKYENRRSWRCIQCLPIPNPVSRFQLGREAAQKTARVTELISSGKELLANDIAHRPPDENLPKSDTDFQDFQSRKDAYGELWKALVNDSSPILGIYGMPGVGKTRMMEQIWKEAKEKNIFNKVTRGNVGNEKLDVIQLQKQIAGHLNCKFDSQDDVESRASQLKQSLLNVGKTLVILDDVWSEIPLDIIGIPCDDGTSSMGSKILLTSREEKVCLRNMCQTIVKITPLQNDEAWDQFKNIVGTAHINSLQDESMAKEVCKKCAGLPLLIHATGKALQCMPYNSWKGALEQLEKGKFQNIPGIDPQVYACVKLSIDKLPDDARSCLFLCCLFPEDADIDISELIQLATGSQLVSDGESWVLTMVDTLRLSSLLLDCEEHGITKLHDIIRDVGRSISFRDPNYAFSHVRCGLRLPDNSGFGSRKFVRLDLECDNVHIPDDLVCPDLHSLWLNCNTYVQQFSDGFFNMFVNLRLLYIEGMSSSLELQHSLQPLGKLRTLILKDCDLTHINKTNVAFFPKNLETLCIWFGDHLEPLDLSNLKYLQKLEITGGSPKFMPNGISSLSGLKELHLQNGFEIWGEGSETGNDGGSVPPNPILAEISKLARLTSLRILLNRSEPFKDATIFDNLQKFYICVGVYPLYYSNNPFKKSIGLCEIRIEEVFERLIRMSENVYLLRTDINVSSIFDSNRQAFTDLRQLYIEECNNTEHLARMLQGEIHHSLRASFSKLTCLEIVRCSTLRYLFCNSVAKCLAQLQKLEIVDCRVIEAIVKNESSSKGDIIYFLNLKELKLTGTPRLRSFHKEMKNAMIPSTLFDGMVDFPSLEKLEIGNLKDASDIWERDYNYNTSGSSFCKLKSLCVYSCDKLETLIPVAMLHKLQNLQRLEIGNCSRMISEVGPYASNSDVWPLLALSHMFLDELPCLEETWLNSRNPSMAMTLYPNLKKLEINNCHSLTKVFRYSSFARDVMHLEEIRIKECKMIREIIGGKGEQEEIAHAIVFPKLKILHLQFLPNLISFWSYSGEDANTRKVEFPNLIDLELSICGEINLEAIEFTCQLESLEISCDNEIQLPCKWLPRLHNLETLILSRCWSHELISVCFQRLKVLKVGNSGCSSLLAFSDFESLQQLERIEISDCAVLEEIVLDDEISGINKKIIKLSHLNTVILKDLPKLKSFIRGENYECLVPNLRKVSVNNCGLSSIFLCSAFKSLQNLEKLKVRDCRLFEGIFECARGDKSSGTSEQIITLSKLSSLKFRNMPDLKSFIHGANYDCYMPALWKMEVDNCGFSTLFTCSVFKNLQQLQELKVSNCRLLEGIVEDERVDETSDTNDNTITLPQLYKIELGHLPNLKSFSTNQSYAFNMPILRCFRLFGCPRVENFTCLNTDTREGYVGTDGYLKLVPDLNDYIKRQLKEEEKEEVEQEEEEPRTNN